MSDWRSSLLIKYWSCRRIVGLQNCRSQKSSSWLRILRIGPDTCCHFSYWAALYEQIWFSYQKIQFSTSVRLHASRNDVKINSCRCVQILNSGVSNCNRGSISIHLTTWKRSSVHLQLLNGRHPDSGARRLWTSANWWRGGSQAGGETARTRHRYVHSGPWFLLVHGWSILGTQHRLQSWHS